MDLILNLKLKFEAKPHEFNCGIEKIGDKNFDYYSHHGAAEMYNDVVCQMLFPHEEELLVVMTSGNASFCFFSATEICRNVFSLFQIPRLSVYNKLDCFFVCFI